MKIVSLVVRYSLLVILAMNVFFAQEHNVLYAIFTPLTLTLLKYALHPFSISLLDNLIYFDGLVAEIGLACIAGAAYFLLSALVLATPTNSRTTIKSIMFLCLSFLTINVIRIVGFAVWLKNGYSYFDQAHMLIWYGGSTLLVALLWIANTRLFKIQGIPFYTDLLFLHREIKGHVH